MNAVLIAAALPAGIALAIIVVHRTAYPPAPAEHGGVGTDAGRIMQRRAGGHGRAFSKRRTRRRRRRPLG